MEIGTSRSATVQRGCSYMMSAKIILSNSNLLNKVHLSGRKFEIGNNLSMCNVWKSKKKKTIKQYDGQNMSYSE